MTSGSFQLHGLDTSGTYVFEDADGGMAMKASGQELMGKGLTLSIDTPRTSRLLFYSLFREGTVNKPDAGDGK